MAYTTGVPAMIGAMMLMTGVWNKPGSTILRNLIPIPLWTPSISGACLEGKLLP